MTNSAVLELARSMHDRIDAAADFLRTIHRADEAYDRAVAEAQYAFRQASDPTETNEPRR